MTGTEDKVREFIFANFPVAKAQGTLDAHVSLMDTGVLDSTGALELISFLESEFELTIEDADLTPENLGTIASIVDYVGRKTGAS